MEDLDRPANDPAHGSADRRGEGSGVSPDVARVDVESPAVGIDATERRRRRARYGAAISATVLLGLCAFQAFADSRAVCMLSYVPCLSTLFSLTALVGARKRQEWSSGLVSIRGGNLVVVPRDVDAGARGLTMRTFPVGDVVQGFWEGPDRVHLVLRSGEAVVARVSRADGDRLLQAAGVSAAERVLRVPLESPAARVPAGASLVGLALGGIFLVALPIAMVFAGALRRYVALGFTGTPTDLPESAAILAIGGLLAVGLGFLIRRREAVIGTDGVLFRGTLRRRFFPYARIAGAAQHPRGAELALRDGRRVVIPTGRVFTPEAEIYRDVLVDRIREGLAGGGGAGMAQVDLERLDRRGRPLAAWREDLGRLLSKAGDYRTRELSAADLGAVIEDPTAPAERRIGAAASASPPRPASTTPSGRRWSRPPRGRSRPPSSNARSGGRRADTPAREPLPSGHGATILGRPMIRTSLSLAALALAALLGIGACTSGDVPGGACGTCAEVYANGGITCGPGAPADAWRTLSDCACGSGACADKCAASFCQTLPTDADCSNCLAMSCAAAEAGCASN